MEFGKIIVCILIFCSTYVFGQQNATHKVEKGETVFGIAKKYNVKEKDIFQLNPKAKKGLKLNMLLQIPLEIVEVEKNEEPFIHVVLPKETLYGISKQYKISIDKIKELNPFIEAEGLKIGAKIQLSNQAKGALIVSAGGIKNSDLVQIDKTPKGNPTSNDASDGNLELTHEVLAKETKYGISKKYSITIAELESLNPEIKNGLPVGYKLVIRKVAKSGEVVTSTPKEVVLKPRTEENTASPKEEVKDNNQSVVITDVPPLSADNLTKAEFLIAKASENLGARYRSGATGNGGFDCSGLMFATYKNLNITLPRSSADMAQNAGIRVEKSQAQKGDLIFFETFGKGRISHVGMVTEVLDDDIKFIHSSTSSGVIVSSTKEAYYAKRFAQINRVLVEEKKKEEEVKN